MDFQSDSPVASFDGGFDEGMFVGPILGNEQCGRCRKVLRKPKQRKCGHLFCSMCLDKLIKTASGPVTDAVYCPRCILEEVIDEESIITPDDVGTNDFAMRKTLGNKRVRCPYNRCTFQGTLKEYESSHELLCPFATIDCPNGCGATPHISLLKNHLDSQCTERKINCEHCKRQLPRKELEAHMKICPNSPAVCDLCGQENIIRERLEHHYENECEFARCNLGCFEPIRKTELDGHYRSKAIPHMKYIADALSRLNVQVGTAAQEAVAEQQEAMASSGEVRQVVQTLKELEEQVKIVDNVCGVFRFEFEKLIESNFTTIQRNDQTSNMITQMQTRIQRLEQAVQIRDVQLMERDIRLQALEDTSYDGTLVWRIDNFADCRRKAQSGEMTSLYSSAFYTSRCGYKMCARLYLNGDGIGKGSHISFFFVVMRGKYDGMLRWPFQQKVTMMLLDYNNQHHVMDAFRPDSGSASFHKPKNEMNVASGCPLFMPLTALQEKITNYVRDDVAYVKVIVDCSDISY